MKKEMFSLDALGHAVTAFRVTVWPNEGKEVTPTSNTRMIPEKKIFPLPDVRNLALIA
jgi:hypothetical protein